MKIAKKDLLNVIGFTANMSKGSPRANSPTANQIWMEASKSGSGFTVRATDGSQFGERKMNTISGEGFAPVCVIGSDFRTIAGLCEDKIEIKAVEGKLLIKAGSDFKRNTYPVADFPTFPAEAGVCLNVPPMSFAAALDSVSFAANTSPAVAEKWGIHVKVTEKSFVCDAYSGIQYARSERKGDKQEVAEFFLPLGFLSNVTDALCEKGAKVYVTEKLLTVLHDQGSYACPLANVPFLNVDAYLSGERKSLGKIKAEDWLPSFNGFIALGGADEKSSCKVSIDGKTFRHIGPAGEAVIPLPKALKECKLNLNAVTFANILEALGEGEADISLSTSGNNALYLSQGDFIAVSSQLRES